jgi:hypothetical protein
MASPQKMSEDWEMNTAALGSCSWMPKQKIVAERRDWRTDRLGRGRVSPALRGLADRDATGFERPSIDR